MTAIPLPIPLDLSAGDHTPAQANARATEDQARRQRMLDKADQLDAQAAELVMHDEFGFNVSALHRQTCWRQEAKRLRHLARLSLDKLTGGVL